MASITDSIKLVIAEEFSYLKIFILSLIPYFAYNLYNGKYFFGDIIDFTLYAIASFLYLGYLLWITNYTIQCKSTILPPLNPFITLWIGLKGTLALAPYLTGAYFLYEKILKNLDYSIVLNKIILGMIIILTLGIIFTALIFYTKKNNTFEALNIVKVIKNFQEITVYLIFTLVIIATITTIIGIIMCYSIRLLFGSGMLFKFSIIYLTTTVLFIYFQNLGYAYFEYLNEK